MLIKRAADGDAAATAAAAVLRQRIRLALDARGRALIAVSGGSTPWPMLQALGREHLDWPNVHVFQVDERWAPDGDPARNLTQLSECLPVSAALHPVPVADSADPETAARIYASTLAQHAGDPVALDVVHLGLGDDGHTASLVPGDPVLEVSNRDVAATGAYQGHRRVTLTYPLLARCRLALWLVSGAAKAAAVRALLGGDATIPGARVKTPYQLLVADRAALSGR